MSSIIVHIGPPKTATTSLQKAADEIDSPQLYFGGTYQPRSRNLGSLCQRVFHYCSKEGGSECSAQELRAEMEKILIKGQSILLSEEMLLLDQRGSSIEHKLKRLAHLLDGFKCKVLITARQGDEALPSLYQEIFNSLPISQQIDFKRFCRSGKALCYDYSSICSRLEDLGFGHIIVLEFKKITTEAINLAHICGVGSSGSRTVMLQRENAGKKLPEAQSRLLPKVTVKRLGRLSLVKYLIDGLGLRNLPGYRQLVSLMDRVHIIPSSNRRLFVPQDVARHLRGSYQKAVLKYGMNGKNAD